MQILSRDLNKSRATIYFSEIRFFIFSNIQISGNGLFFVFYRFV